MRRFLDVVRQQPLSEITADDIRIYAYKALTTIGCSEDFLYFLPRILELESDGSLGVEPEILAGKIEMAGFESWNDERRVAILNWMGAMFDYVFHVDQTGSEIDAWLCVLGRVRIDLILHLERLLCNGPALINVFEHNAISLEQGTLSNAFWDDIPEAKRLVIDWFTSARIKSAIDEQYGVMWNVDPKKLRPS